MTQLDRTEGLVGNTAIKAPVRLCSTTNIGTATGLLTVDGSVSVAGDRILRTAETDTTQNGIWVADTGDWERSQDCDGSRDLVFGSLVKVNSGTSNSGFWYVTTTTDPIIVGTTALAWGQASSVLAVISAFMQTLLDDTTAALARATLGAGDLVPVTAASGTNTVLGTIPAANAAYATGGLYVLIPAVTNTGAATANLTPSGGAALGAKNIFAAGVSLRGGELVASIPVVLQYDGTQFNIVGSSASPPMVDPGQTQGRLTLTTAVPVTTSDVTAAETVYFTPFCGNKIALYTGAAWKQYSFSELSIDVPDATGLYDVFAYDNAGTLALELLAWTNDTTPVARGTQDGVLVKAGATTRKYLGSFYSTVAGNGQTEDSVAKRYLWNYYNRVLRVMRVVEATNTWTYTTAAFQQANAAAANQLDYVQGLSENPVKARVQGAARNTSQGVLAVVGIGLDSTTVNSAQIMPLVRSAVISEPFSVTAEYTGFPGVGRRTLKWLEYSVATGTTTWLGDNADATLVQSGITGELFA